LGEHVDLAESLGIDLHFLIWPGICDFDLGKRGFEEVSDGLGTIFACVLAAVYHSANELGSGIVWSTHRGD